MDIVIPLETSPRATGLGAPRRRHCEPGAGSPRASTKAAKPPGAHILASAVVLLALTAWTAAQARPWAALGCAAAALAPTPRRGPPWVPLTTDPAPHPGLLVLQCGKAQEERWAGRLGNNLLSVLQAALDAEARGMAFGIRNCTHDVLNLTSLDLGARPDLAALPLKRTLTPREAYYKLNLFSYPLYKGLELVLPVAACCARRRVLAPLLARHAAAGSPHPADALVIHVRSGDVFNVGGPILRQYAPPPLVYYRAAIDAHPGPVVVVTEPVLVSPLVAALLDSYPPGRITVQSGSVEEDVAVVLAARHLVVSQGTFAWALALGSSALHSVHTFNNTVHVLDDRALCGVRVVQGWMEGGWIERWNASEGQVSEVLRAPASRLRHRVLELPERCSDGTG